MADQRPPRHLLFICSRNRWRSPTAEGLFRNHPNYQARSAGTEAGARRRVTSGLLGWADVIFTMEEKHRAYLRRKFPDAIAGKRLICLHIPDDFGLNDPELIDLLQAAIPPHLVSPMSAGVDEARGPKDG